MEQLEHFVQFLVHLDQRVVHEAFQLLGLSLRVLHRSRDFLVHLLDNQRELLDLKLLVLDLAVLVLDLAVCNVQIRLQLFKLGDADHVLADLDDFELQFLVFDGLAAQLVAQLFHLLLHLFNLGFLRLSLGFQLGFTLFQVVDFDQVSGNLVLKQLDHLFVQTLFVLQLPLEVINGFLESIKFFQRGLRYVRLAIGSLLKFRQRGLVVLVLVADVHRAVEHAVEDAALRILVHVASRVKLVRLVLALVVVQGALRLLPSGVLIKTGSFRVKPSHFVFH